MPSEKMRYIRQRMAEKPRTDIELTPLKAEIEAVFSPSNLDEDCRTMARLLALTGKRSMIRSAKAIMPMPLPSCSKCLRASLITLWKMSTIPISMTCICPTMFVRI